MLSFGIFNDITNFEDYIKKIKANKLDISVIFSLCDIFVYIKDLR